MQLNQAGLDLIKDFEGLRTTAYLDPVGILTIGYGHTSRAGPPVVYTGQKISSDEAEVILKRDVETFANAVRKAVHQPLSDDQFSALVSFTYNVGPENFRTSSVLRAVNNREYARVPDRLNRWVKAGGRTLPGLVRRRAAEGALFMRSPAPTPVLTPRTAVFSFTYYVRRFVRWLFSRN